MTFVFLFSVTYFLSATAITIVQQYVERLTPTAQLTADWRLTLIIRCTHQMKTTKAGALLAMALDRVESGRSITRYRP